MEFRKPRLEDKEMLLDYVKEHRDSGEFDPGEMYPIMKCLEIIKKIENGEDISDKENVQFETYILVENNRILGNANIRCNVPLIMAEIYGHIGYGVRPSERRKGIATYMLKEALLLCKKRGMTEVILGCYKDNLGSAKTIMNNNGVLYRNGNLMGKEAEYYKIKL